MDLPLLTKRILVVDDEDLIREVIAKKVESSLGYEAIEAANGKEALERIEENPPDLIITDLRMPEMDGIQLLGEIRAQHRTTPVIILTGYGSMEDAIAAIRLGASSFLRKPFDINEVIALVENIFTLQQEHVDIKDVTPFIRNQSFTIKIPNNYLYLSKAISYIFATIRDNWEIQPADLNDLKVALYEALLNAFEHGNLKVNKATKERCLLSGHHVYRKYLLEQMNLEQNRRKSITVFVSVDRIRAEIKVLDEGEGFDYSQVYEDLDTETFLRTYGRGLFLIKTLMDEISFNGRGSMIRILKYRPRIPAGREEKWGASPEELEPPRA